MSPIRTVGYEHPEPALRLSIGEAPTTSRGYPTKLDWIRAKPGADGQWEQAARAFNKRYNVPHDGGRVTGGPKAVPIYFRSNRIADVLDVRYMAWGQGRIAAKGTTNYAEHPEMANEAETLIIYQPDRPDPFEYRISGPNDPYLLGGQHGIPADKDGKPTINKETTLYFGLVDVGTFTAPVALTTKGQKSTARLQQQLLAIRATGTLTGWVMMLRVVPARVTYWDQKEGKRRRSQTYVWDIAGPVERRESEDGKPYWHQLDLIEVDQRIGELHQRRMLEGIPEHGIAATGQLPPPRQPAEVGPGEQPEPDEAWAPADDAGEVESTATEVAGDGDEQIPFPD